MKYLIKEEGVLNLPFKQFIRHLAYYCGSKRYLAEIMQVKQQHARNNNPAYAAHEPLAEARVAPGFGHEREHEVFQA